MTLTVPSLPFLTFDLEVALQAVANRSFYEDTTISPLLSVVDAGRVGDASSVVGYWVTAQGAEISTDEVLWTYAGGITGGLPGESSRLHDAAEFYDNSDHVRYNLSESVEMLEHGQAAVSFAYVVVTMSPDDPDYEDDADNIVGWALQAARDIA